MLGKKVDAKILITGASGFIGRRLRDALLDAGADVVSIRRAGSPESKRGRSAVADYADLDGLRRLIAAEKPDLVFHVAGATKGVTYADFHRANVMPTKNLLEALSREHDRLARFVHVSSLTSYGPSTPERPHVESDPREPIEFYGQSKLEAEVVVESYGDRLPWTIVRPGGVYGPGDVDYFNLFKLVSQGFNFYFGNRQRWFSAIYVDDCVRATVDAALSPATKGKGYFLCDGRPITWEQFQQLIIEKHGKRVRDVDFPEVLVDFAALGAELITRIDKKPRLFNRQKAKMGAQKAWTCTHRAAQSDFGYTPEVATEDGIRQSLAWYREQGWIR
ncbi:MAG: NAD(P)-dependent oxidoreductase [Deltaproteobacteria bacterium]|nr:NAD(P)-dependent oxidoreductase [Deltaproteobacteria bacterium]